MLAYALTELHLILPLSASQVLVQNVLCTPQAAHLVLTSPPPPTADLPLAPGSSHRYSKPNITLDSKYTWRETDKEKHVCVFRFQHSSLHAFDYSGWVYILLSVIMMLGYF